MTGTSLLRRGLPGLLAALALAAVPAAASADGISIGLNGCAAQTVEHPFASWGDNSNYVLAPGGTFEGSLDGWKLTGGAKVVSGSEPFAAHGAGEDLALSLPSGSSATTPQVCVGVLDPTMRYFAANDGGLLSLMSVQILFYPPGGGVISLPLGVNARRQGLGAVVAHAHHRQPPRRAERRRGDGRLPLHARSDSARSGGSTTSTSIPTLDTNRPAALTPCGGGHPPRGAQRAQGRQVAAPFASNGGAQAEGKGLRAVVD